MISVNRLHARFFRPEHGWDPVPEMYAKNYGDNKWKQGTSEELLKQIDDWVGGISGKTVLDLGGGPGQYSIAFAELGAKVVWHDVSSFYLNYAKDKALHYNQDIEFSLGYMDEAPALLTRQFDFVFNRICWNYCWSDRAFSNIIFDLIARDGSCYIETNHSDWNRDSLNLYCSIRTYLNDNYALKIGHPFPRHGLLANIFSQKPISRMYLDYHSLPDKDKILFQKRG